MLPFGTMDPVTSLKAAQEIYAEATNPSEVFESKFNQIFLSRTAGVSYNLGTSFLRDDLSDLKG